MFLPQVSVELVELIVPSGNAPGALSQVYLHLVDDDFLSLNYFLIERRNGHLKVKNIILSVAKSES